jgi:glycine cleavage system regulatory protein
MAASVLKAGCCWSSSRRLRKYINKEYAFIIHVECSPHVLDGIRRTVRERISVDTNITFLN